MKKLLAIAALALLSTPAQAVDVTLSFTAGELNRVVAVCTAATKPVDAQTPPQPRSCTNAETKAWVIAHLKNAVINYEQALAVKAATDGVSTSAFNPQ